ncbi:hypothetical protein X777_03650 [Ooceraea biroi]|uniref:Uncharacterized protein n=1 Tax=Ooceraea biroi TaxID=2015173 RepID=A0A026WIW6_OOCBI|nr:hypothetical protein X777_03650 [Ooceraea biroi]
MRRPGYDRTSAAFIQSSNKRSERDCTLVVRCHPEEEEGHFGIHGGVPRL